MFKTMLRWLKKNGEIEEELNVVEIKPCRVALVKVILPPREAIRMKQPCLVNLNLLPPPAEPRTAATMTGPGKKKILYGDKRKKKRGLRDYAIGSKQKKGRYVAHITYIMTKGFLFDLKGRCSKRC